MWMPRVRTCAQVKSAGVAACLIDFTASRLRTADGAVACCDLAQDPELFEGPKGNVQVRPTFHTFHAFSRHAPYC